MSKLIATITVPLIILGSCGCSSDTREIEQKFVGRPAAVALDYYGVGYYDLEMLDEPPCLLSAVYFKVKTRNGVEPVYLWLDANPPLYSEERSWDYQAIRNAKVIKITHELLPAAISPFRERGEKGR